MKLIRFGQPGQEKPGIISADDQKLDVSAHIHDYDETFFASDGLQQLEGQLEHLKRNCPTIHSSERMGPPIARPSKIICIGLNYIDHAKEGGMDVPPEPMIFFKATSAFCGPFDPLVIPRNSEKTDWEVELAIVIGKKASYIEEKDAFQYIAGYALHNDYSERAFQKERSGQWVKGKSADTFAPFGPILVTKDEIPDPNQLNLWLKLNGELKQDSNTSQMIFKVPFLVSYLSQFMTLLPGDVISTGTPAGVGMGHKPPLYLKAGDRVELSVEKLGTQHQQVLPWSERPL